MIPNKVFSCFFLSQKNQRYLLHFCNLLLIFKEHGNVVEVLIINGVEMNHQNDNENTGFHMAAFKGLSSSENSCKCLSNLC